MYFSKMLPNSYGPAFLGATFFTCSEIIYKKTLPFNWWSSDIFGMGCVSSFDNYFAISIKFSNKRYKFNKTTYIFLPTIEKAWKTSFAIEFLKKSQLCKRHKQT